MEREQVLNNIIRYALHNRMLVLVAAVLIMAYGLFTATRLPVDVFPDLNRPTVTVMTEAPGLAPEEIETQVTFHLETALNGAPGVTRVRSTSGVGLSVVYIEFEWDTDIRWDRQVVQERLTQIAEKLPKGVTPSMGPVSSIMGEIMLIGMTGGDSVNPMEVRTLADWNVRPKLLSVPGVAQVTVMGGGRKQYQVLADPERMRRYGVTFAELKVALQESNENTGGGFVVSQNQEFLVRNLGRVRNAGEIAQSIVKTQQNFPVRVGDVADVREAPQVKRGDGSVNGKPAVILAIQKQPGADTRKLTAALDDTLVGIRKDLPKGVEMEPNLFRQAHFIESAVSNVEEALRDGAILVTIILFIFLLNFRTTAITLTAIPLSLLSTAIVFKLLGQSINTMTLGGIAVAIGELVDDAIVDVENVHRRLQENAHLSQPRPIVDVIFSASSEIRNSIVFGTAVVMLVFIPLFALPGIEGRLFSPLAIAYIVSILMSLIVSLTVTPVLCSFLLGNEKVHGEHKDGFVLRACKAAARGFYRVTFPHPWIVLGIAGVVVAIAGFLVTQLGTDFLPPFNEGTATINVLAQPGTSLEESNRLGTIAEELLLSIPEVKSTGRRTGRAEQDEHAEGVNSSEIDVDFFTEKEIRETAKNTTAASRKPPQTIRPKPEILKEINDKLGDLPGVVVNTGQPISHRIDHLLSGVRAQIAVKIAGPDLETLRKLARQVEAAMKGVPGVVQLQVEQQVLIPEVRIRVKREAAARYGFKSGELMEAFEAAMNGQVVSQVIDGQQIYDLALWTPESVRQNIEKLGDMPLVSPSGAVVLLSDVADVVATPGPNQINREDVARRIVVFCNTAGRDLGSTVAEIKASVKEDVEGKLPEGYFISYGGQFESQQSATRLLLILGFFSLIAMFALLYAHFQSVALVAQVMLNIPFAFIGSVAALLIAGETFSVASLVGFISLTGVASRNGILMISHYVHLMTEEGVPFSRELVVRGSQERVAPVLMTALTAGLALVPLILSKGQSGKEILYPVALVVLGGLITSTLLDFAITPTVFLNFSGKAAEAVAQKHLAQKKESKATGTLIEAAGE